MFKWRKDHGLLAVSGGLLTSLPYFYIFTFTFYIFMEWQKETYFISTDKEKIDIPVVHAFLTQSYWAKGIPEATVRRSIKGSLCFSIFHEERQIGFARVITDEATFAYLADVFVLEAYRGRGLSKWLMEVVTSYPSLTGLRRFLLATRDAHGLYAKFGFTPLPDLKPWMQVHKPDIYQAKNEAE
jgi:GNAT superfamily N-acetyltransferase